MCPRMLNGIKRQLVEWGYPKSLVEKMEPKRILKCYQNEKAFQEYATIREKEYYLSQLLKNPGWLDKPGCITRYCVKETHPPHRDKGEL